MLGDSSKSKDIFSSEEWNTLLKRNNINFIDQNKLTKSIIHGYPSNTRGYLWKLLSKSSTIALNHDKNLFKSLLETSNKPIESLIKKDIERTVLTIEDTSLSLLLKEKQKKLYKVLKAYSVYDPQVGYCQGTNFIVLTLLTHISSSKSAFWVFVQLMHDKDWRSMFINNTPKLINVLDKLVCNIKLKLQDLYEHFQKENVNFIFLI